MSELLPCPFCGGDASLSRFQPGPVWACGCDGCEIGFHGQKQPIADAWNQRAPTWQPIETAPRDGTTVLVYAPGADPKKWAAYLSPIICQAAYHPDAGWCVCEAREVTHWMPIPEPPQ